MNDSDDNTFYESYDSQKNDNGVTTPPENENVEEKPPKSAQNSLNTPNSPDMSNAPNTLINDPFSPEKPQDTNMDKLDKLNTTLDPINTLGAGPSAGVPPRDSVIDTFKLNEPIVFTPTAYSPCCNYLIQQTARQIASNLQAKPANHQTAIADGISSFKSLFNQLQTITTQIQQSKNVDWSQYEALINDNLDVDSIDRLIVTGIPEEIRSIVWQVWSKSNNTATNDLYYLKSQKLPEQEPSIHEKQIKKDITRNNFYNSLNSYNKVGEVTNILKIFSNLNPEIGYNQSMIFIVSPINLIMNELESYNVFNTLMNDYGILKLFNFDMSGLHLMLYKFDRLLELLAPKLFNHMINQGIKSSMYASQWFLTFFTYKLPVEVVLVIYDHIMFENIDYLLKFSINLLLQNYQQLMLLRFDELLGFLRDKIFVKFVSAKYYDQPVARGSGGGSDGAKLPGDYFNLQLLFDYSTLPQLANLNPNQLHKFLLEFEHIWAKNHSKQEEINQLNLVNGKLRNEIKYLQLKLSTLNQDHLTLVQSLIDLKIKLPELMQNNEDLRAEIEDLTEKLANFNTTSELELMPEDIETEISRLLEINKQETERNIALDDEYTRLSDLDQELTEKLAVYKKKWFWNK